MHTLLLLLVFLLVGCVLQVVIVLVVHLSLQLVLQVLTITTLVVEHKRIALIVILGTTVLEPITLHPPANAKLVITVLVEMCHQHLSTSLRRLDITR